MSNFMERILCIRKNSGMVKDLLLGQVYFKKGIRNFRSL